MSVVEFKESITPTELHRWRSISNSSITEKLITIHPGGSIEHTFIPLNTDDKFIATKYRLLIKYKKNTQSITNGISCLFDLIMMMENSDVDTIKHQVITARALSIIDNAMCDVVFNSKGGNADSFKFRLRNNGDSSVEIESIELLPSYAVDDDTVTIVQQLLPTLVHASNLNPISVGDKDTLLIKLNAGTTSDTSLSLHSLINGICDVDDTITLYLTMNDVNLPFSPLVIDVKSGNFLISVPAAIMRVTTGRNEFKMFMKCNNSNIIIDKNKVQCSLEGKGLIQGGGSVRPSAYVTERYRLEYKILPGALETKNEGVTITIQKPITVIESENSIINEVKHKSLIVKSNFDIEKNYER